MNAAARQRLLPDVRTRSKGARYRLKDSLQTDLASDKPAQILSKEDVAQSRNSLMHSICVEMLRGGFHRSFSELFSLLSSEEAQRAAAEPGSALSLQAPLAEQQDKLETIRLHLCRAEQAERTGSWSVACDQRLLLGLHFSAPEDLWLRLHFYHSCADREQGGRSRPATEARACMAELYLQRGDLEQAKLQAEACLKQAEDGGWMDSAGQPLRLRARQALCRIYSRLADAPPAASDHHQALTLLHRGHSMAAESEDKRLQGEAACRLGLAYQRAGDHGTARKLFSTYMQICGTVQDTDGLGEAYEAMARSHDSKGNVDEAVRCLEELADISRSNGMQHKLADACVSLGRIYYSLRQYTRAWESFLQGFAVACDVGDMALLQKAQVWAATARAHGTMRDHITDVEAATPVALQRLVAWKATRGRQPLSADSAAHTATVHWQQHIGQ
ncbi:tetratricopeptide repeat protein 29 isoform X2 [Betta splendens]|uniref:Tetratricopeptide repeat protein 29 n=1 Tax=Betta splendens TaxID=158456 RepID=A0A9W2Y6T1_BETSP|nr:tetratricopeptide repeat protein 29 isoform X2 [Betta splendens]